VIHYTLQCGRGHSFDGWFKSSDAFEDQSARGILECPLCGTPDVSRALMAPAVRTRGAEVEHVAEAGHVVEAELPAPPADQTPAEPAPLRGEGGPPTHAALSKGERERFIKAIRTLRQAVMSEGTDVGANFAEEARRIHYGEAEPRGIYGQADLEEARELVEEGIKILPLPQLPEDRN